MKQSVVLAGCYIVLALATIAAYEGVRRNDFVHYDDSLYVSSNPHITGGLTRESVSWAFTTPHFGTWHPLTSLSHMLDCELFGLDSFWHHLTNLLFHTANTLLLFWVLKRMTGALWPSVFVAAAFALHPLQVESVAWVAERKNVLSGFFWMLTIAAYIRYAKRPGIGRYLPVVLVFSLGLMAKPTMITLPFALLLLDYWPLRRLQWQRRGQAEDLPQSEPLKLNCQKSSPWRLITEKIPLFILTAVLSIITYVVQQGRGFMKWGENLTPGIRISNALVSYIRYILKMVYPTRLAVLYPHPRESLALWQPIVCFMVLAVVSAVIIYMARRRRYLMVGWLWYLGTLVPVIGLVQVGGQAMADRYAYLPSIGIFIMVAWGAAELAARLRLQKTGLGIWAGMVLIVLATCTRAQVRHWKDRLSLYSHAVAVTKDNFVMHYNYGNVMLERGRLDLAIKHYAEALRIEPDRAHIHNNLGHVLFRKGRLDEAIKHYTEALRIDPNFAHVYNNLGHAFVRQGKLNEGIEHYIEALRLLPNNPVYTSNLEIALKKQGNIGETIKVWKKVLEFNPDNAEAYYNLAVALSADGKIAQAITYYNKALSHNPDMVNANYNLGNAYLKMGQLSEAGKYYARALNLAPDLAEAHHNLGIVLLKQGKPEKAVHHWNKALQLKPDSPDVLNNLAWIMAVSEDTKIQNPATAVEFAQRACELTNYRQPRMLDTLAVAYAAVGRFSEAVTTAEKALGLALSSKQQELAEVIRKRLKLYKAEQPYRESL